jgi:hypothetical protein
MNATNRWSAVVLFSIAMVLSLAAGSFGQLGGPGEVPCEDRCLRAWWLHKSVTGDPFLNPGVGDYYYDITKNGNPCLRLWLSSPSAVEEDPSGIIVLHEKKRISEPWCASFCPIPGSGTIESPCICFWGVVGASEGVENCYYDRYVPDQIGNCVPR